MSVDEGYVMAFEDSDEAIHRVTILGKKTETLKIKYSSTGETEEINADDFFPKDSSAEEGVENLSDLNYFNEAGLLINLQKRFLKQEIFTSMGLSLIIVNPYENSEFFSEKMIETYAFSDTKSLPSHLYATTKSVYQEFYEKDSNQMVLLLGESSSGKSQTSKHIKSFLSKIQTEGSKDVENKILSFSSILEAFGNAKTVANDNSSRFGKLEKFYYNSNKTQIISVSIDCFLLEKNRIVSRGPDERNFHIFYSLLKHGPISLLQELGLSGQQRVSLGKFNYLKGEADEGAVDYKEIYERLLQAFEIHLFSSAEIKGIWNVIAAVLCIGNIEFDDSRFNNNNPCKITENSQSFLENTAKLLEIPEETFIKSLIFSKNTESDILDPIAKNVCISLRNTFATNLYEKLFF